MMKWPVEIFRYSENKGWELYQQSSSSKASPPPPSSSSKSEKNSNSIANSKVIQTNQMDDNDENEGVTAVPRKGCVEVKKLRLRVHLFHKTANKNVISNESSTSPVASNRQKRDSAHTTVIRRRDTILLSSRRGLGAVVFKFRSIAACMSFVDKLIELNSDYVFNQTEDRDIQRPVKRLRVCHQEKDNNNDQSKSCTSDSRTSISNEEEIQSNERSDEIRSYIVRLLHDGDFMDFVDNVEESLSSSPDCARILEALDKSK